MTGSWFRRWLARVALAVLAPLALLLLAEIGLRLASAGIEPSWVVADGAGGWRDNPDIGRLWFAPGQVRSPVPFRAAKEFSGVRIVLLGESAAMGDPVPAFGMARQLELLLQGRFAGMDVQVVNAAMTAIDSSVIVSIAHDIAKLKPDFVVVYMGNNEVVGPFGPGSGPAKDASLLLYSRTARLVLALRSTRTGQWLRETWHALADRPAGTWRGLEQFTGRVVDPESAVLAKIHQRFGENLARIVSVIRQSGAEPVLATVASRPFWAPFGPVEVPGGAEALKLHQASRQWLGDGQRDRAIEATLASRDADPLRFRADGSMNEMVRAFSNRAEVVDVEAEVLRSMMLPGQLFWDHVHFTPEGNFLAARILAEAIGRRLEQGGRVPGGVWAERDEVLRQLVFSRWDDLNTTSVMYGRLVRPPFTALVDHRELVGDITGRFRDLRNSVGLAGVEATRQALAAVCAGSPMDPLHGARWVRILEELERKEEAMAVARRLLDEWPHVRSHHHLLGRFLVASGQAGPGLLELEQGEVPGSSRPRPLARIEAAAGLAESGRVSEALALLDLVLAEDPGYAKAWYNRAVIYSRLGQLDRAQDDFRMALSVEPDMVEAFNNLGVIALKLNRLDDAERHFRQAIALHPYHVGALRNLANVLASRGDRSGAEEIMAVLALCDPDWEPSNGEIKKK